MAQKFKQYRGRIDLQKSSLETLEANLPQAQNDVINCELDLAKHIESHLKEINIEDIREEINRLNEQRALLSAAMNPLQKHELKNGIMGSIFGVKEWPAHNQTRWRELYTRYKPICDRLNALNRLLEGVRKREDELRIAKSWLLRLETAISRKRKKKDSIIELRAAAAASSKQTREIADTVKRKIARQSLCPYCGNPLGSSTHVDHIYPVSKGGRSVPKNMVHVCAKCNLTKSDLTLAAFIRKFSLDRDVIEERLKQLHKDF